MTTAELARIVGVPVASIRTSVERGTLRPARRGAAALGAGDRWIPRQALGIACLRACRYRGVSVEGARRPAVEGS